MLVLGCDEELAERGDAGDYDRCEERFSAVNGKWEQGIYTYAHLDEAPEVEPRDIRGLVRGVVQVDSDYRYSHDYRSDGEDAEQN